MPGRRMGPWAMAAACGILLCPSLRVRADDWPQWRGPGRDGVWQETGIVSKLPGPRIPIKWRAEIAGGYSGPTVANGRVYVTDRLAQPQEVERVHCLDAADGRKLWTHTYPARYRQVGYPAGPRAAVTVADGRAYALGTMGHFHCLDAATGEVLWAKDFQREYRARVPIWGISAAPLADGQRVIVQVGGADGACLVALDAATGAERWRALDDRASYSAPVILRQAGRRVLVCWTGDSVAGLDPNSGTVHWRHPFAPHRMVINVPTPVVSGERLFVAGFYDGSLMLRLRPDRLAVEELWRRRGRSERDTDALHCMMSTPLLLGEFVYGVDSYGELRCLDARTGDRVWEDLTATPKARWSNIHMVRNGERVWLFNERGELIVATLSPKGFGEISRSKLIDPTTGQLSQRGGVCWSPPAFAGRCVFARNDRELLCASLAAPDAAD
ncbi:MAG TPA: PQQ-binding-like beta-propeller repeat protein [Phycisphaerae bacterium]|nr:PQQ-binding-like beta-propeller repeat protein [Phycisphaerae bacterium]